MNRKGSSCCEQLLPQTVNKGTISEQQEIVPLS